MADEQKGVVAAGFRLLWRRQRVLWWVFVVNFVCGGLGAVPTMMTASRALGHSLAGQKLTNGFALGIFGELLRLPNVNLLRSSATVYIMSCLFLLFMFFVSGGILECYREDRSLSAGEFFAASGAFFWRFIRLALLSIVPFIIVWMSHQALSKGADSARGSCHRRSGRNLPIYRHRDLPHALLAVGAAVVRHRESARSDNE